MKTCFKCKIAKPRSEFYAHPQMADGLIGKCKACTKADVKANYIANYDHYQAYERKREQQPERRLKLFKYLRTMREVHPEHNRARQLVNYHIRAGKLVKKPCEFCGSTKVEAHHDDYSKPLDVRWLCHRHHRMVHGTLAARPMESEPLSAYQQPAQLKEPSERRSKTDHDGEIPTHGI